MDIVGLGDTMNYCVCIFQDKKDKIYRFHKINKFRRKRNMKLTLCWERQW